MNALLIILTVIASLLILLLLLLFLGSANVRISFCGELKVVLSVLGIHFRLVPSRKKNKPKSKAEREKDAKRAKEKREKKKLKKQEKKAKIAAGEPVPNLLENMAMIFSLLKTAYRKVRGKLYLRAYRFHIRVATPDAAQTALLYGAVTGSAALILQWMDEHFIPVSRGNGDMTIVPDYLSEKTQADIDILLGIRLYRALGIAIAMLAAFRKEQAAATEKARRRIQKKAERKRLKAERSK